ncbi:SGNH/GDSL hydrolase family protein [Rhizobium sp. BK251]|uniref:SGNH/GDSL hydrolase family protein n=1 Tax=Rhizobium sp. BK251 TaxID=2512125 RepID=UPI00104DF9DD|nr:SGNH/GDSL hydrolase family protein [Rhizobium sp. BK251]TCL70665.1 lysophospholipase L1-like esterase [Rhizobium sp. BK251]
MIGLSLSITPRGGASLPPWFPLNRKIAYIGDSIPNGSAASNSIYAFPNQSNIHAGLLHNPISLNVVKGTPGDTSAGGLARFSTDIAATNPAVVVILFGANDANMANAVPAATYGANLAGMIALAPGKQIVVVTPPPRASGATDAATINARIVQYRQWILDNAATLGYRVADAYTALQTSGSLNPTYDSGDGLHPNDEGHQKIARLVGAQIKASQIARTSLVAALNASNLIPNGLMAGTLGAGSPTGWINGTPVTSGTAPTLTKIASPNDAFTSSGQGYRVDCTAAATTSIRRTNGTIGSGFTAGDKLLVVGKLRANPGALDWDDLCVDQKTARASVQFTNGSTGADLVAITRSGAIDQEFAMSYTVAGGITQICHQIRLDLPSGAQASVDAFEWGMFNLTALGLASSILV